MAPRLNEPSNERANSQAVNVVPILAPMMTPMAWVSVMSPALTKLTSISVVAVDDCTSAVTTKPVSRQRPVLDVMRAMNVRRELPANFCKPPLINDMPKRNMPRHPSILRI